MIIRINKSYVATVPPTCGNLDCKALIETPFNVCRFSATVNDTKYRCLVPLCLDCAAGIGSGTPFKLVVEKQQKE